MTSVSFFFVLDSCTRSYLAKKKKNGYLFDSWECSYLGSKSVYYPYVKKLPSVSRLKMVEERKQISMYTEETKKSMKPSPFLVASGRPWPKARVGV